MTKKQLEAAAKKLAQKTYDAAQMLFDDEGMTDELADGMIFTLLFDMQGSAEEITDL
jgi:hypothetical protein